MKIHCMLLKNCSAPDMIAYEEEITLLKQRTLMLSERKTFFVPLGFFSDTHTPDIQTYETYRTYGFKPCKAYAPVLDKTSLLDFLFEKEARSNYEEFAITDGEEISAYPSGAIIHFVPTGQNSLIRKRRDIHEAYGEPRFSASMDIDEFENLFIKQKDTCASMSADLIMSEEMDAKTFFPFQEEYSTAFTHGFDRLSFLRPIDIDRLLETSIWFEDRLSEIINYLDDKYGRGKDRRVKMNADKIALAIFPSMIV